MADIHLEREHRLGLPAARKVAFLWAEQAETEFGMQCLYEKGTASDLVSFSRAGVQGTLAVTGSAFEVDAKLGFLLGAFRDTIEAGIAKKLDALLTSQAAASGPKKTARRQKNA